MYSLRGDFELNDNFLEKHNLKHKFIISDSILTEALRTLDNQQLARMILTFMDLQIEQMEKEIDLLKSEMPNLSTRVRRAWIQIIEELVALRPIKCADFAYQDDAAVEDLNRISDIQEKAKHLFD